MNFYALFRTFELIGQYLYLPTDKFVFGQLNRYGQQTWIILTQDEMTRYLTWAFCNSEPTGTPNGTPLLF